MEELKEKYAEKTIEMQEKYKEIVYAIAEKEKVDLGVAFDMLKAVARGADYAEGIELDVDQLKADCEELTAISKQIRGE